MISMSKFEMIQYLKDYANLQYLMMQYPDKQIGILFDSYMQSSGRIECDNREYYTKMRRVYMIYIMMKRFSYLEDYLLNRDNFLNNNEIDDIIPNNSYSTDLNGLTKKKVLQLIRDGFNHNNDTDEIDRFKISPNGKNIEIEFLNIKHSDRSVKPVRLKFAATQIVELYNEITAKRQNSLNISFEIPDDFDINSDRLNEQVNKIKFIHYYFKNKLQKSTIEQFNVFHDVKSLSAEDANVMSSYFHDLSNSIGEFCKFELTEDQKSKLVSYIERYRILNPKLLEGDVNAIMYYFLRKIIPIPGLKDRLLFNQIFYCERLMEDVNKNSNQILDEVLQILNGKNPFNDDDTFDQDTFRMFSARKDSDNMSLFKDLLDGEMTVEIPVIIYIDSVITHCCKNDEIIKIAKKEYKAEGIRNSFAHGRWFISTDNCISLFDADPKNINDYNLNHVGKIDIGLFEKWADAYIAQNRDRINVPKRTNRK